MTIRNDATRLRIPAKDPRRPRAVVARQGLALLDTDLDQQSRHQLERIETETADTLGSPGKLLVPAGNAGFLVAPGATPATFTIGKGRGYLDGWLLENAAACTLATQPHPRVAPFVPADVVASPALVALKALVRYVDPVEDPAFADIALRDAQASGRSLADWQVFPFALGGAGPASCASSPGTAAWQALIAPSTGTLTVIEQAAAAGTDPCSLTPGGGYTRLENLLYRFEVHGGVANAAFPTVDGPRFQLNQLQIKYSRRNASVLARITNVAGTEVTVGAAALDPRNWFEPGRYAEVVSSHDDVDPRAALATPRMFRVALAVDDRVVLEEGTAGDVVKTGATGDGTWFLRLWDAFPDGQGLATVVAPGAAVESQVIDTGDGITVKVGKGATTGTFRRGDFWTCDARADGSVGWLKVLNVAQAMTPHGPEVRYASIAAMNGAANAIAFEDCRIPFSTLSDRLLVYRGGDGQGVFAPAGAGMQQMPAMLRVGVVRGEAPVPGAQVRWTFVGPAGGSSLIGGSLCDAGHSPQSTTNGDGLAEVTWAIDSARQGDVHQVQASLVGGAGLLVPPIVFSAVFETAARTGYTPGPCPHLAGLDNVQDALDTLCAKIGDPKPKALTLRSILLIDHQDHAIELIEKEQVILNALGVHERAFEHGIFFGLDGVPMGDMEKFDPVAEIELDVPYPTTDPDKLYWATAAAANPVHGQGRTLSRPFGFQRVRLDGTINVLKKGGGERKWPGLRWIPSREAMYLLESAALHRWGATITPDFAAALKKAGWIQTFPERILCRIRLRSARIWTEGEDGPIYLNAEHLGTNKGKTTRGLLVQDVDPQRAADLDMFIYLMPKAR